MNMVQCHACGKKFRSMSAEAKHRHNFPALCDKRSRMWREFQIELHAAQERDRERRGLTSASDDAR